MMTVFNKQTKDLRYSYDYEVDLIETVKNSLYLFLPSTPSIVATQEVRIGAGIVDILLGGANDIQVILDRLKDEKTRSEKLKGKKAVIISCLYSRRPLSVQTVSRRCGLPQDSVHALLEELVTSGFCRKPSVNTYVVAPISKQFPHIVSIEGKLNKWKVALQQAYRNRLFSTFSYVVLDEYTSRPAINNINLFIRHQVGLAVANASTQKVKFMYRPRCAKPISSVYSLLASEALFDSVHNNIGILPKELENVI